MLTNREMYGILVSVENGGAGVLASEDARFDLNVLLAQDEVLTRLRRSRHLCDFLSAYPVDTNDDRTMFCRLVRKLGDAEDCASLLVSHMPVLQKLTGMAADNKKAMTALSCLLERTCDHVPELLRNGTFIESVLSWCTLPTIQKTIQAAPLLTAVFKGAGTRRASAVGLYLTLLLLPFNGGRAHASFFGEPPRLLRVITLPEARRANVPEDVRAAHALADTDVLRPLYSTVNKARDARNTDAHALATLLVEAADVPPVAEEVMRAIGLLCRVLREEKMEKWKNQLGSKKEEQVRTQTLERLESVAFLYLQQNPRELRLVETFLKTRTKHDAGLVCVPNATAEVSSADKGIHAFLRAHVHPIEDCEKCVVSRKDAAARAAFTLEGGRGRTFDSRKRRCCSLYEHAVTQQDLVAKLSEYTSQLGNGQVMREKQKKQKVAAFMLAEHGVGLIGQQSTDFKVSLLGEPKVGSALRVAQGGRVKVGLSCKATVYNNVRSVYMGFTLR